MKKIIITLILVVSSFSLAGCCGTDTGCCGGCGSSSCCSDNNW